MGLCPRMTELTDVSEVDGKRSHVFVSSVESSCRSSVRIIFNFRRPTPTHTDDIASRIGGLGHLAIQYAAKFGYTVVAISRGTKKKAHAMELGVRVRYDRYTTGDSCHDPHVLHRGDHGLMIRSAATVQG